MRFRDRFEGGQLLGRELARRLGKRDGRCAYDHSAAEPIFHLFLQGIDAQYCRKFRTGQEIRDKFR